MDLNAIAAQTSCELDQLWDEIGLPASERAQHTSQLQQDIKYVCGKAVQDARQRKQDLMGELGKLQSQVAHSRQQLELEPEDWKDSPGADTSLLHRHRYWKAKLEGVLQMKQVRIEEIRTALQQLHRNLDRIGDPCPQEFQSLDEEGDISLQRLETLRQRLHASEATITELQAQVETLAKTLAELIVELGIREEEGYTEVDELVMECPEISPHRDIIRKIQERIHVLEEVKDERAQQLRGLAQQIAGLWKRLAVPKETQQTFLEGHPGLHKSSIRAVSLDCPPATFFSFSSSSPIRTLPFPFPSLPSCPTSRTAQCEEELERLHQLKEQQMQDLIQRARERIRRLWEETFTAESDQEPYHDLLNQEEPQDDELLEAHERLIAALEAKAAEIRPLIRLVEKREKIEADRIEYERTSQDPNRFKIPKRMLQEERFRRVLSNVLPKINEQLKVGIAAWEAKNGPFVVNGQRYLDAMAEHDALLRAKEQLERDQKESRRRNSKFGGLHTQQGIAADPGAISAALAPHGTPSASGTPRRRSSRIASAKKRSSRREPSHPPPPLPSLAGNGGSAVRHRRPSQSQQQQQQQQQHQENSSAAANPELGGNSCLQLDSKPMPYGHVPSKALALAGMEDGGNGGNEEGSGIPRRTRSSSRRKLAAGPSSRARRPSQSQPISRPKRHKTNPVVPSWAYQ